MTQGLATKGKLAKSMSMGMATGGYLDNTGVSGEETDSGLYPAPSFVVSIKRVQSKFRSST